MGVHLCPPFVLISLHEAVFSAQAPVSLASPSSAFCSAGLLGRGLTSLSHCGILAEKYPFIIQVPQGDESGWRPLLAHLPLQPPCAWARGTFNALSASGCGVVCTGLVSQVCPCPERSESLGQVPPPPHPHQHHPCVGTTRLGWPHSGAHLSSPNSTGYFRNSPASLASWLTS